MSDAAAIAAALGAAAGYAASSVAQHRSARAAPASVDTALGLVTHLASRPLWLLGLLAAAVALVLQAVALAFGPLAVVQPLLVCGLLFALPASVLLERRRPSLAEWAWAALLVAGLTVFLTVAAPSAGQSLAPTSRLAPAVAAGALLAAAAVLVGHGPAARYRAVALALAAGITYGLAAALIKQVSAQVQTDPAQLVASWPAYTLVLVGAAALVLNQAAYQAGPLAASLPPLTIADPVVAVALGATSFGERLVHGGGALTLEVLAFATMALASVQLARRTAEGTAGDEGVLRPVAAPK